MYNDTAAGRAYAVTPAELAIAEGVIAEVPEPDDGEVALEHYSAQAAAIVAERRRDAELWRSLFRAEGEPAADYLWRLAEEPAKQIRLSRAATVKVLADFLDGNMGEARMLLDVAGDLPLRCSGWVVGAVCHA